MPATRLAIIDSGGANIASLQFAIERLGLPSDLTTDPARLHDASHVILPGVGAAADCMSRLEKADLVDTIRALTQPVLGICVGMQLLFDSSEEGNVPCLGMLPGRVQRFANRADLPVPLRWSYRVMLKTSRMGILISLPPLIAPWLSVRSDNPPTNLTWTLSSHGLIGKSGMYSGCSLRSTELLSLVK